MSKYNRAGHVCPNTGRVAMTVAEVTELQNEVGDVHSFTYDKEAEGFGTDPWRLIDGINPMVDKAQSELWFDNGGSKLVKNNIMLYVQMPKALKPCPFCGCEAKETTTDWMHWLVQCSNPSCGVKIQRGIVNERTMSVCQAITRIAWNRRAK
jgi:hypothetical protein